MKFDFKKQGAAGSPNYNIEKSGEEKGERAKKIVAGYYKL